MRKGDAIIMKIGDTILDAAAESGIDKVGALSTTSRHAMHSSIKNTSQISEMLPMDNI